MSGQVARWLLIAFGILGGLLLCVILVGCPQRLTVEQMDQKIRRNLVVGSDRADVIRFLEREDIEYRQPDERLISATVWSVGGGPPLTQVDINTEFRFDDRGRLVDWKVREVLTAP